MRAPIIGAVVAGVASFLVWSYMKRFEEEASGGPRVMVLTVVRTLEAGAVLKDADIAERGIPQAYVDSRAIRSSERQRITNLRVSWPIDAQQVLNWSDIVATNDERMMSSLVQPNMRAVSIQTEGRGSTMVRPGDRVDVIATLPQPGSGDQHRASVVLLQNILVLGRSTQGTSLSGGGEGTSTILSLSLQNSQLLAVAGDKAKLSLALRSSEDVRVQDGLGEISSTSLLEQEKKAAPAKAKSGPVALGGAK
jgi:pilus assembly protein CpaB